MHRWFGQYKINSMYLENRRISISYVSAEQNIFWRMLVTQQVSIDFHHMDNNNNGR